MRRSRRLQVLPPNSPHVVEGSEGETMDRPTMTDSHVEGVLVIESREEIPTFQIPIIVQEPST